MTANETTRAGGLVPAGEPGRRTPIGGYTDDPAANARHSADIADIMAERSSAQANRAAANAAAALSAWRLAGSAADKAVLAADSAPHAAGSGGVERFLAVIGVLALATCAEFACVIAIYAVAKPVFAEIDNVESPPNIISWTAPAAKGYDATPNLGIGARP